MSWIKNKSSLQIQYILNLFYSCNYIPALKSNSLRRGWKRLDPEKNSFELKKHLLNIQLKKQFLGLERNFVYSEEKKIDLLALKKIFLNQQNFF